MRSHTCSISSFVEWSFIEMIMVLSPKTKTHSFEWVAFI
jgi:hypothetical protein